jgi:hypothetical protein
MKKRNTHWCVRLMGWPSAIPCQRSCCAASETAPCSRRAGVRAPPSSRRTSSSPCSKLCPTPTASASKTNDCTCTVDDQPPHTYLNEPFAVVAQTALKHGFVLLEGWVLVEDAPRRSHVFVPLAQVCRGGYLLQARHRKCAIRQ